MIIQTATTVDSDAPKRAAIRGELHHENVYSVNIEVPNRVNIAKTVYSGIRKPIKSGTP